MPVSSLRNKISKGLHRCISSPWGKRKKGLRKKKKKKRGLRQNPDLVGNKYIDATTYSRTLLKPPSLEIRNPNIQPVNRAMWGQYRDPNSIKRRPDCKYGHATTLRRLVPLLNHFRDSNPKPPDVGTLVDTSRVNGYNCTIKKKKKDSIPGRGLHRHQ